MRRNMIYSRGHVLRSRARRWYFITPVIAVLMLVSVVLYQTLSVRASGTVPPSLTQEDYVFENDDLDGATDETAQAGSLFTSPKTLTNVRQGERTNLRVHLKNTGSGTLDASDQLALFYDKGDGMWSRVQSEAEVNPVTNSGCDDSDFHCETILTTSTPAYIDTAVDPQSGAIWAAFHHTGSGELRTIHYVGVGGSGCTNDAYTCSRIDDTSADVGEHASIAIGSDGKKWIAYGDESNGDLMVAEYVGSGGSGCRTGVVTWSCVIVDSSVTDTGEEIDIAIGPDNVPWISYYADVGDNLRVARYVGTGGDCTSSAWSCESVHITGDIGAQTAITVDQDSEPWVAYTDGDTNDLWVARRDGGNSGCETGGDSDWTCEQVETNDAVGNTPSIVIGTDDRAIVSYRNTTDGDLMVATRTAGGSGGNCDDAAYAGSDAWDCLSIQVEDVYARTKIALAPDGNPWISYRDETNADLWVAQYVGSGGTGCGVGGTTVWTCKLVESTGAAGVDNSLLFDVNGNVWLFHHNLGSAGIDVARMTRQGEILASASQHYASGASLTESHADMTSPTDTANRDSADCVSTGTWNNGRYFASESGSGLALAAGDVTPQCTEVVWTLDTSQAIAGQTYRFVVASTNNAAADNAIWRGPAAIDEYPQLTISAEIDQSLRYSKALLHTYTDCSSFDGDAGGSADWGCEAVIDGDSANDFYENSSFAFDPSGTPYIIATNYNEALNTTGSNLVVASYVGSGGNCDGFDDTGGSDAWECTTVIDGDSANDYFKTSDLVFSPSGTPYIVATNYNEALNTTGSNLVVASYVGSGGNCDGFDDTGGSDAWECTTVIDGDDANDYYENVSLAFSPGGTPYIVATNYGAGGSDLVIAAYVRTGGNCDGFDDTGGSDAWQCTTVIGGDHLNDHLYTGDVAFNSTGTPYIVTTNYEASGGSNLVVAYYVDSNGNCDIFDGGSGSDAWQCTTVINGDVANDYHRNASLAFSPSGTPNIVTTNYDEADNTTGSNLVVASYVGTGGNCNSFDAAGGSAAWQCTTIIDGDDANDYYENSSLAFTPDGTPYVSATNYNEALNTTGSNVVVAYNVGSGGNCDGFDDTGGSDAWQCTTVIDGDSANDSFLSVDMALSPSGTPYFVATNYNEALNTTGSNLMVGALNLPTPSLASGNDLAYMLSSGRSDYDETGLSCGGNNNFAGYCGLFADNGGYDSLVADGPNESPVYAMATEYAANSELPSILWIGNTNLAPSTASTAGDIVMEVYRFGTTNAWEEVARNDTTTNCSSDNCQLHGQPSGTASEYFETINSNYWVYVRVRQVVDGTTTITFKTDSFRAQQLVSGLHHGSFFREGEKLPLNQRR